MACTTCHLSPGTGRLTATSRQVAVTEPSTRQRAPELAGSGPWYGVDQPLSLSLFRGRIVVVWFFCPSSETSLRVWDELCDLRERFGDILNIVGVHMPKFDAERLPGAVDVAIAQLGLDIPVVDDATRNVARAYGVRGWPTCVLVDPQGFVVSGIIGEGVEEALSPAIEALMVAGQSIGALVADPMVAMLRVNPRPLPSPTTFRYPRGVGASDELSSIAIADTGNNRVVVCGPGGVLTHTFEDIAQPSDVVFDGDSIVIVETGSDRVVAISLTTRIRTVVADGIVSPRSIAVISAGVYVVTESARHRLWRVDATTGESGVIAGTGAEDLVDSRSDSALLAQPSGICRIAGAVAFVDCSSSALRTLDDSGRVRTLIGRGLFDWGDADGTANGALLQGPSGVAAGPDGVVYIADTFNNLIRVYADGRVATLGVGGLKRPSGLAVLGDGTLLIADTANHRIVMANADQAIQVPFVPAIEGVSVDAPEIESFRDPDDIRRVSAQLDMDAVLVRSGQRLRLSWTVTLGDGEYLDASGDDAVTVSVWAEPGSLLTPGARSWAVGDSRGHITLAVRPGQGSVYVEVTARILANSRLVTRTQLRKIPLRVD